MTEIRLMNLIAKPEKQMKHKLGKKLTPIIIHAVKELYELQLENMRQAKVS